jgi:ubiquitin-like-conjugating enzyme ATG3
MELLKTPNEQIPWTPPPITGNSFEAEMARKGREEKARKEKEEKEEKARKEKEEKEKKEEKARKENEEKGRKKMEETARKEGNGGSPAFTGNSCYSSARCSPADFLRAGNALVASFPTWRWETGDIRMIDAKLPPGKQYLLTRNVPARQYTTETVDGWLCRSVEVDGWQVCCGDIAGGQTQGGNNDESNKDNEYADKLAQEGIDESKEDKEGNEYADMDEFDEYADMDEFEDDKLIQEGDCDLKPEDSFLWSEYPDDEILRTRTYDLAIQFRDNIPHIWLFGWDENRQALSHAQIREDIHLKAAIRFQMNPHVGLFGALVDPCALIDLMNCINPAMKPRIESYMFVLLKSIQPVVPLIDYDFTREVSLVEDFEYPCCEQQQQEEEQQQQQQQGIGSSQVTM